MNRHLLCVNKNRKNLEILDEFLRKEGYEVTGVSELEEFGRAVEGDTPVGLAIVDLTGFSPEIWQYCERLRQKGIPFLIISPRQIKELDLQGMKHGAKGILVKPIKPPHLLKLIEELLEG